METLLINEALVHALVHTFKSWREGKVLKGMRFRNRLFRYVAPFSYQERDQAFDLAGRLCQSHQEVLVTTTTLRYTVWVNLPSGTGVQRASGSACDTQPERSNWQPVTLP